jgi:hypothetical protein
MIPNSLITEFNVNSNNANNNAIFPFINKSTNNKQKASRTVFVLNILEHYRKYTRDGIVYNPRIETFDASKKAIYENITTLSQLDNSTLSPLFKKIVYENIDAIMTLINNGVTVPYIELGNEMHVKCANATTTKCFLTNINNNNVTNYNNFIAGNNITFKNGCLDQVIQASDVEKLFWWHVPVTVNITTFDPRTVYTLDCYAALCKMYINIIKNLRPNDGIRFGMPWAIPSKNNNVWGYYYQNHVWATYMLDKKQYIGYDDVVYHPYFTSDMNPNANSGNLDTDMSASLTYINNYFSEYINYRNTTNLLSYNISRIPVSSKIWITEWNILASGSMAINNNKIYNTFLDSYFYSEHLMSFVEANVFSTIKNKYSISNLYTYNGHGSQFNYSLFHLNYNDPNVYYKRAKYYAHKIMLPIINNTNGYKYVNTPNAGLTNVPNGVKFRAFYKEPVPIPDNLRINPPVNNNPPPLVEANSGELLLYFHNTSGSNQLINIDEYLPFISNINGKSYRSWYTKKYAIWSDKLFASRGKTSFLNNETISTNPSQTIQFLNTNNEGEDETDIADEDFDESTGNFIIKKYSIGYIKFKIYENKNNWCGTPVQVRKSKLDEIMAGSKIFTIYPNPAKDNVHIEYAGNTNKNARIQMYSINGQIVEDRNIEVSEGVNKYIIPTTSLAKGTYILKLINDQETKTEKIVIQ